MWGTPSFLAYIALVSWIGLSLLFFARLRLPVATMYTILGGALFLPERVVFNTPLIPPIDKEAIASLSALLGMWLWHRDRLASSRPFRGLEHLVWLMAVGWVLTVLANDDQIPNAGEVGQPMALYDIPVGAIRILVWSWLPFFLGRIAFQDARDLGDFLRLMIVAGFVYSFFAMWELRMSPQLHRTFYGFHQHLFVQQARGSGYRPMVFMTHGLVVAKFFTGCLFCAAILVRSRRRVLGRKPILWVAYFLVMMVLCKSVGAMLLSMVCVPAILLLTPVLQLRLALVVASLVFFYPLIRLAGFVPTEQLVELATEYINKDRAHSLEGRFAQEDVRIEKFSARPWVGWGTNSRTNVYESVGSVDEATIDGEWLMVFGSRGILGFVCWFGLYLFPIVLAYRKRRSFSRQELTAIAGLSLACAFLTLDLIPNSSSTYPQFFIAGVLNGVVAGTVAAQRRRRARAAAEDHVRTDAPEPALGAAAQGAI